MGAFGMAFAGIVTVALLQDSEPFYYDSGRYWWLGEAFFDEGRFSLLNFDNALRGYFLPLLLHGARAAADWLGLADASAVKIINSLLFAVIATILAPQLAALAWPESRWRMGRRLVLAGLLVVFWAGYLKFPLSDFPALTAVLLAIVAIGRFDAPGWMLVAGLATSAAINIRPAYLLVLPALAIVVALSWREQRRDAIGSLGRRTLCVGLFAAGFVAVALPQSLASHRQYDTASFLPGAAAELPSLQFTEGLRLQRYDTYVGEGNGPRMLYVDDTGSEILRRQDGGRVEDLGQYVRILFAHPLAAAGLFGRHLVNGLDQRYNTPYIEHLDTGSHRWMRLAGFLIVFLALVRLLWPAARRSLGHARWRYLLALAACGLTSLGSAVETRFLLPLALLSYMLVLAPGWPSPIASKEAGRRRLLTPVLLIVGLAAFLAVVISIAESATEHLRFA